MMTLCSRPDFHPVVVRRSAPQPRLLDVVQETAAAESVEYAMNAPEAVHEPGAASSAAGLRCCSWLSLARGRRRW